MEGDIIGQLYEDAVSFGTDSSFIENQRFLLIDESKYKIIEYWRKHYNIIGIIGLESGKITRKSIIGHREVEIASIADNLLYKYSKSERIIGINLNAPSESTLLLFHSKGFMAKGELHFGGFKSKVFEPNEPVWASMGKNGADFSPRTFSMDMRIKCKDKIIMDTCTGVIDTGGIFTFVSEQVPKV